MQSQNSVAESRRLRPRHDGHEEKAEGYYSANDDIVKYGFWILVTLVLSSWLTARAIKFLLQRHRTQGYARVDTDPDQKSNSYTASDTSQYTSKRIVSRIFGMTQVAFDKIRRRRIAVQDRRLRYFNPPSFGKLLFLGLYWVIILASLWTNVIFESSSDLYGIQWEVVGFRAAWVSTTQLPLLYATGCRINVISLVTGITHERLNWFHRWIARTVFMTLIVHWAFFYREWDIAGSVRQEIDMMPMVIWGFAAWGAIGLMVLTGFGWFRDQHFEVWLVSHIMLAWAVLALSYTHTHCTTYFVGASLGMLVTDLTGRALLALLHNVHWWSNLGSVKGFGHTATLTRLDDDYLRLTLEGYRFKWRAGQHVYVTVPCIRLFQSHPFTIIGAGTNAHEPSGELVSVIIKAHSGFTRRLHKIASKASTSHLRVLLHGPYGNPPSPHHKDVIILIATGNRVSFTISMLASITRQAVRRANVIFHWIVPSIQMVIWYKAELQSCLSECAASDIRLKICIYVTQAGMGQILRSSPIADTSDDDMFSIGRHSDDSSQSLIDESVMKHQQTSTTPLNSFPLTSLTATQMSNKDEDSIALLQSEQLQHHEDSDMASKLVETITPHGSVFNTRPSASGLVRPTVEDAGPEQSVMVLAAVPRALAADISNEVSRLVSTRVDDRLSRRDIDLWIEENDS